jgi:molybdopterin-guanine dinucleotide biosynthesis protein A
MLPISCAILMGGKNSRMGGQNKAFSKLNGQTILSRINSVAKPIFDEIIFVTNDSETEYGKYLPDVVVRDIIAGRGPMSGIHAALSVCRNNWCFVFACDLPQLDAELIIEQCQHIVSGYEAIVPRHASGIEPLHALYSKNLVKPLENYLNCCKDNKILLFLKTTNTLFWDVDYQNAFININSPDDLEKQINEHKKSPMENFEHKKIIEKYPPKREYLIQMLTDIQDSHPQNYLPNEALLEVVRYTKLSMSAVMGVVQYYSMFSTKPKGRFLVRVCKSPVCINKESDRIATAIMKHYNISEMGAASPDGLISVEYSECLGRCAEGGSVSINQVYIERPRASTIVSKIEHFIKNQHHD